MWLTDEDERETIRRTAETRTADLAADDLTALGYWDWLDGLQRGVAAHHAGLIPVFKETVEELFTAGLIRAVFATETLALGINMPARTVVIDRLRKFNGETHVDVTAGEYTQLTGPGRTPRDRHRGPRRRAVGPADRPEPRRRAGLDPHLSAAVVVPPVLQHGGEPDRRHRLRPRPRDAGVLVRPVPGRPLGGGRGPRGPIAGSGDRGRGRRRCSARAAISREYARMRRELKVLQNQTARSGRAQAKAATAQALESLKRGDVIDVPSGRRAGWAVVLDNPTTPTSDPRPLVLTAERWAGRLSVLDFPTPAEVAAQLRVPKHFDHRSPQARRDLASALRGLDLAPRGAAPGRVAAGPGRGRRHRPARRRDPGPPVPLVPRPERRTPARPNGSPAWSGNSRPRATGCRDAPTPWPGRSTASAPCLTDRGLLAAGAGRPAGPGHPAGEAAGRDLGRERSADRRVHPRTGLGRARRPRPGRGGVLPGVRGPSRRRAGRRAAVRGAEDRRGGHEPDLDRGGARPRANTA